MTFWHFWAKFWDFMVKIGFFWRFFFLAFLVGVLRLKWSKGREKIWEFGDGILGWDLGIWDSRTGNFGIVGGKSRGPRSPTSTTSAANFAQKSQNFGENLG